MRYGPLGPFPSQILYIKNRIRGYTPLGKIYTKKILIWGCMSIFLSHNGEIWHEGVDLGLPPQAKFGKNRLRGYTPFLQFWGL